MMIAIIIMALLVLGVWLFMKQPKFGKLPSGDSLQKIKNPFNYKDGEFKNLSHTPNLAEGVSMPTVMKDFFFNKSTRNKPSAILPSKKTDLLNLAADKNVMVWFGHSSYFLQIDGKKMLVDPVFSGSASPIKPTTRSFKGSDVYTVDDFPAIDYLFISHDHWDHLDYETILKLRSKVKKVITALGVAEHLESWGYNKDNIIEKNWNEEVVLDEGFIVNITPGRHFSGRAFKRNQSLWVSFVLKTPAMKIFLGGDSGYDTHFKNIGEKFGPFDLAILECGQYNPYWKYIHMMPEEVVQAGIDLNAKKIIPVHWAKFSLAIHAWDDPIIRVTKEAERKNMPILYPMIGEEVNLSGDNNFIKWWENIS